MGEGHGVKTCEILEFEYGARERGFIIPIVIMQDMGSDSSFIREDFTQYKQLGPCGCINPVLDGKPMPFCINLKLTAIIFLLPFHDLLQSLLRCYYVFVNNKSLFGEVSLLSCFHSYKQCV